MVLRDNLILRNFGSNNICLYFDYKPGVFINPPLFVISIILHWLYLKAIFYRVYIGKYKLHSILITHFIKNMRILKNLFAFIFYSMERRKHFFEIKGFSECHIFLDRYSKHSLYCVFCCATCWPQNFSTSHFPIYKFNLCTCSKTSK